MANSSEGRERERRLLGPEGEAGLIMLPKSLPVTSAEVRFACLRDRFDPGVAPLRLEVGP